MLIATPARAQDKALEARYGRWGASGEFTTLETMLAGPALGPAWYGAGFVVASGDTGGAHRYLGLALDVTILKHHSRLGPYVVAGTGIGALTNGTSDVAAVWSLGGGLEWNPFAFAGLQVEARYRALDPGVRGFWRLATDAPRDLSWSAGVTVRWGYRAVPATRGTTAAPLPTRVEGAAANVVETAIAQMGAPYRWGGTDANGFDCSGLIQYAYAQHGITLPRMSRDQARAGMPVPAESSALAAGDILAFSAVPGGQVTHVGLYVGGGRFIHSSRDGVTISLLSATDPIGRWWWDRWVGARRLIAR